MTIRAIVHNRRIELPLDVAIDEGSEVEITLPENRRPATLAEHLAPFVGSVRSGVGDLAENHDHYLYGAPRQKP